MTAECGFSDDLATYWETTQTLTGPERFLVFTVKQVQEILQNLRRRRNLPIDVTANQENEFMDTMYVVMGRYFSSRPTEIADLTQAARLQWGRALRTQLAYKETTDVPDCSNYPRNWVEAFDSLFEYYNTIIGESDKIPLVYLLRNDEFVPLHADDPETNYSSKYSQMCKRMPMNDTLPSGDVVRTKFYDEDNRKLWEKLSLIFKGSVHFTHLKPFQKERDGRGAYQALRSQYLGPKVTRSMAKDADDEINKLRYVGEKRRYNFDTYVNAHKRIHNVYDDLKATGHHEGISEETKVRKLMAGINNRHLEAIKGQVCTSDELGENFEKCVGAFKTYIAQSKHLFTGDDKDRSVGIGAVNTNKKRHNDQVNWDTSDVEVELRHYSPEEYKRLTGPQKLKLKRHRQGGHTEDELKRTMYNPEHPTMKKVIGMMRNATISNSSRKNQSAQAKKAQAAKKNAAAKSGNRNNKALVKQVTAVDADDDDKDE